MDYDVCLSFAGEDRAYVREVADDLRGPAVRVFYDEYEEATLWGKNLYTHLDEIYQRAARYCVMFISEHYRRKLWTDHERESAQARAFIEAREYILPARFDDTEIPGLRATIGYVDLRRHTPARLADLICTKLGTSSLARDERDREVPRVGWAEPIVIESSGGSDRINLYQRVPVASELPYLDAAVSRSVDALGRLAVREDRLVRWTHPPDRYFDRLYATSSVAAALTQLGVGTAGPLVRRSTAFLRDADAGSIDDRAATMHLLATGQLDAARTAAFLTTLADHQDSDPRSDYHGSFLLAQGPSEASDRNRSPAQLHADGASFHACHVADVLLHIPPEQDVNRRAAEPILAGIRGYLGRALTRRDGRLVNLAGHVTPLTLYGYAVCPSLSLPLPGQWREVAVEAIELLARPDCALPTRCFGVMNCAYLCFATGDPEFRLVARRHVAAELTRLTDPALLSVSGARDISLILRALVYGVRLIDDRAAAFLSMAARLAVQQIDLEFRADDDR